MTTELVQAAARVVSTQRQLSAPNVRTARNAPHEQDVARTRLRAANAALRDLSVAAAAEKFPRAWVSATADGLRVHKVRNAHDSVACTGLRVRGTDIVASVVALADMDPCPDCDWRLL